MNKEKGWERGTGIPPLTTVRRILNSTIFLAVSGWLRMVRRRSGSHSSTTVSRILNLTIFLAVSGWLRMGEWGGDHTPLHLFSLRRDF